MCVCSSGSIESQYLLSPSFSLAQLSDVLCERGARGPCDGCTELVIALP